MATQATRDSNRVPSLIGVSSLDTSSTELAYINPSTHRLLVDATATISGTVAVTQDTSPWVVSLTSTTITGTVAATQSGTWNVGSNSATGSAVPANAFFGGMNGASGLLVGLNARGGTTATGAANNIPLVVTPYFYNGTNNDQALNVVNGTNSTGTGIQAVGILAQLDDTSPTSITENQFGNLRMSADRSLLITPRATTPTQTSVASSASSVSLLASNTARKGATIVNDSSALLYLKLGATASTTSYSVVLAGASAAPFAYYEVPFGYIGAIDGIWASATGNARITELT